MDTRSVLGGEALPPPIDKKVLKLTVMTLSQLLAKQGRVRRGAATVRQQQLTLHIFSH